AEGTGVAFDLGVVGRVVDQAVDAPVGAQRHGERGTYGVLVSDVGADGGARPARRHHLAGARRVEVDDDRHAARRGDCARVVGAKQPGAAGDDHDAALEIERAPRRLHLRAERRTLGQNHASNRSSASQKPSPSLTWPCQISGMKLADGATRASASASPAKSTSPSPICSPSPSTPWASTTCTWAMASASTDTQSARPRCAWLAASCEWAMSRHSRVPVRRQNSAVSSGSTNRLQNRRPPRYHGKGGRVWASTSTPSVSRRRRLSATRSYIDQRSPRLTKPSVEKPPMLSTTFGPRPPAGARGSARAKEGCVARGGSRKRDGPS